MEQEYNIGRLFLDVAERNPEKPLIKLTKSELSYGQVRTLVLSFALRMKQLGIGQNSCVALDTQHHSVAAASFLAIALLGGRWVQATKSALAEKRLGTTHVLHDGSNPFPSMPGVIRIDPSWSTPPTSASNGKLSFEGYTSANAPWMYSQSSGTTGTPKLMALSYRNMVGRAFNVANAGFTDSLVASSSAPPLAPPGATAFCVICLRGGTSVVGGDYKFWQSSSVNLVAGTPVQIVARLKDAVPPAEGKIEMARIGGAKSTPEFLKMVFRYFNTVGIGYGSSEAGPVCVRVLTPDDTDVEELGPPITGAELEIVDEHDLPVVPGVEGTVRIRTNYMVASYVADDEATNSMFRGGWFYPGDVGRLSAAGSLKITGRTNDQLSIGGVKVNALLVDRVLESVPEVADGICFTEPGAHDVPVLSVVVSLRDGAKDEAVADLIRGLCAKSISRAVVPTNVYVADKVPRNERGKATRHLAAGLAPGWRKY